MKRFALFSGDVYYPRGGWTDFQGSFDTIEEALLMHAISSRYEWFHVIDLTTGEEVATG